jgi:hypothetical protein
VESVAFLAATAALAAESGSDDVWVSSREEIWRGEGKQRTGEETLQEDEGKLNGRQEQQDGRR